MSPDPSRKLFAGKWCHFFLSQFIINSHGAESAAESQPNNGKLLMYGKRLLRIKADNHLCWQVCWWSLIYFSVMRNGIVFIAPNNQDQNLIFKIFFLHKTGCMRCLEIEYRISSIIRQSFFLPKQSQRSCKTDLDLWDCLGRVNIGIMAKFHRTDLVI